MLLIGLFFISSADSASVVLGMLSQRGTINPSKWMVALWGVCIAGVAAALTLAGGLQVMQSATILVATPFLLVLVVISVNLVRELRKEPYTSTLDPQVRRAVLAHSHQGNPANGRVLDLTSPDDTSRRTPLARQ
jgi:choline-glycine betaine transporter